MGTARNFHVKTGLTVDSGDIVISSGNLEVNSGHVDIDSIKIDGQTISTVTGDEDINITPNGTGSVVISKVDINAGTIDGATIATSNITVGSSKTLDVSAGTLTLANDQISGDKVSGGTIGTTTITALAGDLSLGDNNITNVGVINADSISVDAAATGLKVDFSGADTGTAELSLGDDLANALEITQASASYMKFTTTTGSEQIVFGKNSTFNGTTIADLGTVTTANIDGGTVDSVTIGGGTPAAGTFTALTANDSLTVNAGAAIAGDTAGEITLKVTAASSQSADIFEVNLNNGTEKFSVSNTGTTVIATADINGGAIDGTTIGASSAAAGTFSSLTATTADINGGTIDGATVGANSASTGKFTTLQATGDASVNGTAKETHTQLQVNADANQHGEFRLHADIGNDDLAGLTYDGVGGLMIVDQAEDVHVAQATVFTQGRSGTGNSWAVGRQNPDNTGANVFHIGYVAKPYDGVVNSTDDPTRNNNYVMELDTSGNAKFLGDIILDDGGSLKEAGGTAAITFDGSGNVTKIGQDTPSTNQVLTWHSGGYAVWSASASGADGMGSGFVLEDGDGTEVTIDEDKEVKFIDGDGIEINWTDVSTGSDGDPYDLTFSLDIDGMTDIGAGVVSGDLLIIDDGANGTNRKTTVDRIATAFAGDGLTASGVSLTVNADQSSIITAVGTLTSLDVDGNATVDGATISLDATTSLNIDNSNTSNGITIGTATSGVPISIGHTTSEVTVNDNLTVTGDLTVNGTTTTISTSQLTVEDDLITVSKGNDTVANANGSGMEIEATGATNLHWKYVHARTAWQSNVDIDLATTSESFKIAGTDVLTNNTLGSGVVTSSLTTVGALNSGSITSGFTSIDTGSGAISTTGTLTGGSIVGTSLAVSGTITGDTSLTLDSTTITTAEIGVLDSVTAGTVAASKALVVDSNKDLGTIRNVTSNGTVQASTLSVDAVAILDTGSADGQTVANGAAHAAVTYADGTYRTAKFVYQISDGTDFESGEILVNYKGASAPANSDAIFMTQYAVVSTKSGNASLVSWDAVLNSGNIELRFTNGSGGSVDYDYRVVNTLLIK